MSNKDNDDIIYLDEEIPEINYFEVVSINEIIKNNPNFIAFSKEEIYNELFNFVKTKSKTECFLKLFYEIVNKKTNVNNFIVIADANRGDYEDLNIEEFHVLLLNQRNKLIKSVKISQGGISSTSVDVRLIFKAALDFYATKIILVHNHPSGNLTPSLQDNEITSRIVDLGKMIEINVLDHLIITNNGYFSYADKNLL